MAAIENRALAGGADYYERLDARYRRLVDAYLVTGSEWRACELAGIPEEERRTAFHSEFVRLAIYYELKHRVTAGGAIGQNVLEEIAQDVNAPAAARVSASRALRSPLDALIECELKGNLLATKTLSELSIDELRALVDRLESERAGQAKTVDCAAIPAPLDQASDLIE